jgi:hypothetical protein
MQVPQPKGRRNDRVGGRITRVNVDAGTLAKSQDGCRAANDSLPSSLPRALVTDGTRVLKI